MAIRKLFLGGVVASAVVLPATAAAAAVTLPPPHLPPGPIPTLPGSPTPFSPPFSPQTFTAHTTFQHVSDVGGGGVWASDDITRTLTITETGATPVPSGGKVYHYTATIADTGTFETLPGALTPNQGGQNKFQHINGIVGGTLTGTASYTFSSTYTPNNTPNLGVPGYVGGPNAAAPTATWWEQAFPGLAAPGFTGETSGPSSRTYTASIQGGNHGQGGYWFSYRIYRHHHWIPRRSWIPQLPGGQEQYPGGQQQEQWVNSSTNGNGQTPGDGNITGY